MFFFFVVRIIFFSLLGFHLAAGALFRWTGGMLDETGVAPITFTMPPRIQTPVLSATTSSKLHVHASLWTRATT